MPRVLYTALMNLALNEGPLSEIVYFGVPCSFHTWVRNSSATSLASMSSLQGMKCDIRVNRSLKTRTESKPLDGGSLTIISYSTSSQGAEGVGSGCAGTRVLLRFLLR